MAAPSTQSPPLGYDEATMQFLQDSLRPPNATLPTLPDYNSYYEQGANIAAQLQAAQISGLHAQQAQQSIAASQAAAQLAAAKSPYELALLQAKTDAIPLDKKYNSTLQQAQIDEMEANAAKRRAQSQNYSGASRAVEPFSPPSFQAPSLPTSTDVTLPTFSPGTLSAPGFDLDSTSGATSDTPTPLLGSVAPSVDSSLATTLPTSDASLPGVDMNNLVAVSGAENPATATTYRNGSPSQFTAKATGYHPVSPDSPDYQMEGGDLDAQGNPIHTLDAFRRGEVPDVTVAVDRSSPLFGQSGFSPDLKAPVKFTDTGGAFKGKGTSRVDVARDTAAGANSDENNGDLTFQVGPSPGQIANGPLVQVSGAENPSTAVVYQNGQSNAAQGVRVPKSQDELEAQRNYANGWIARQTALLSQTNNPRQQNAIKAEIAGVQNALNRSEQIYLSSARKGSAPTPSTDPLAAYPDVPGYYKIPTKGAGGKLDVSYVSENDASDQKRAQTYQTLRNAQDLVKENTGGATLSEFFGATPTADGNFTVTHVDNDKGIDIPIQRTLPGPVYNQLAGIVRPAVYGAPKAESKASDTDAKIAALATDPEFGGRTDNVLPTGLTPMSLVLGRQVMSSAPRPTYAPTPISSVQSSLDQATANLPATNDPLLQQGEQAIAAQQNASADTNAAAQADAKVKKSYAYAREQQVNAAQTEVQRKRDALASLLQSNPGTSDAVGTVAPTPAIAQATREYKQAQAKYLAARDFANYTLGDNEAYQYVDPFRTNSSYTGGGGLTGQVNGANLTLRAQ